MFAYLLVTAAPVFFFFSAWLLMVFEGLLADEYGINRIGYPTAMLTTLAFWLVLAPLAAAASRRRPRGRHGG